MAGYCSCFVIKAGSFNPDSLSWSLFSVGTRLFGYNVRGTGLLTTTFYAFCIAIPS